MAADYSGQVDILDPDKFIWPIHLIGCGSIGTAVFTLLAGSGIPTIHLWDADTVEERNRPSQKPYRRSDVGAPKVEALRQYAVRQELDCEVIPHGQFVTADTPLEGIVISGVDSMDSRQVIWDAIWANVGLVKLYIDGRVGGEQGEILAFRPSDGNAREVYTTKRLFPASKAEPLPCGGRAIAHSPAEVAVHTMAAIIRFAKGEAPTFQVMFHLRTAQYVSKS